MSSHCDSGGGGMGSHIAEEERETEEVKILEQSRPAGYNSRDYPKLSVAPWG